ncbi:MAG: hypothetical protein EA339_15195 [Rhodobacteraceae bacterium]|nr:MAG: hypothetical protein EA339_15195 [Paracoccaceae bacterium]
MAQVPQIEALALHDATGRVLAHDVAAPVPFRLLDNAAMDGYACRPADLEGQGPWVLPVAGRIRAGDAPGVLPPSSSMRILTEALLPQGSDGRDRQDFAAAGAVGSSSCAAGGSAW